MDRFLLLDKLKKSKPINRNDFIEQKCLDKVVLDLGCIRHNAEFALRDPNWLHRKIKKVAKRIVGIDYLPSEIEKLQIAGYDIILADITKPISLDENYDIIVAGDLIEHLTNFEGFFDNCTRLLKKDGILIITTPNPFYIDEFLFVAFKRSYLINPEHTCWIDPQALSQLGARFGYKIDEVYFIRESWQLKNLICETAHHRYDILNGVWQNDTFTFKVVRKGLGIVFNLFYAPFKVLTGMNSKLIRYSDYLAVLKKNDSLANGGVR